MKPFDATGYLREIARGKHGARDLTRMQARTLFTAIFAGEVEDLALGAILVALRIKGESVDELNGMLDAIAPHVRPLTLPVRRAAAVVLPSYNGARKLPNLVPLLALLLAREGIPVLLHGAFQEPHRVGTFEILEIVGHAPAASLDEAAGRLEQHHIAAVPIALLSPALARLIDVRTRVGVRNCGHTLAKLILPGGVAPAQACRLIAVTHPDFAALLRDHFSSVPANVFLMRGVEGEAIMRLHAPQPIEYVGMDGVPATLDVGEGEADVHLPSRDAHATAQWTLAALGGKVAIPRALAGQVALIADRCRKVAASTPLKLVSSK